MTLVKERLMKSPGSLVFLWLLGAALHASVTASLDTNLAKKGEAVTLMLRVEGKKITMPSIGSICGVRVESHERRTVLESSEGAFQKAEIYSFKFRPSADCVIEPIAVEVDGTESFSQPLRLKVDGDSSKEDTGVAVKLRSSKKELYVGEPFELELIVRKPETEKMVVSTAAPEMEHLWIKKVFKTDYMKEGGYSVATTRYLLAPQQAGSLRIYPAEVKVASGHKSIDAWGNARRERSWESFYSNALELKVKPLPENVDLVGYFSIELAVDTNEVKAKEPLTAELTVRGMGNFEDIPAFKPLINGVELFGAEPILETNGEGTKESWHQKLTFIGERSFTIPPVILDYFDPKEKRVKRVQTQPIAIHVTGANIEAAPIKSADVQQSRGLTMGWAVMIYLFGALSTVVFYLLPWRRWLERVSEPRQIREGDDRRALMILLMHREKPDVQEIIEKLEERLYGGKEVAIDKKELKRVLKRYQD
jgi:hypothetical protein